MNWRWLIYDHIPTELMIPKEKRRAIKKEVQSNADIFFEPHALKTSFVGIITFLLLIYIFSKSMIFLESRYPSFGFPIMAVLLFILCYFLFAILFRSLYQKKTYQLLRQSGYDICTQCGYWLKGLDNTTKQCPECGTKRKPLPEPAPEEHDPLT